MQIHPYLYFDGRCDEAIEFYKTAVGARVEMLMRYRENPQPQGMAEKLPAGFENKVMHSTLTIGQSTVHFSDGLCRGNPSFSSFSLSLTLKDDAEAVRIFAALSDGGTVTMPISQTFFASSFGMLTDRFGVPWMVLVHRSA